MDSRTIIIGDPHGCLEEFKDLLVACAYTDKDKVVVVGDLVDRGPDSVGIIAFIRNHPKNFRCVMGNHDLKHVRMYQHMELKRKNQNYKIPMRPFGTDKMAVFNSLGDEAFEWLASLPYYIELEDNWVVVHAGLAPGKNRTMPEQDRGQMCHIRFLDRDSKRSLSLKENFEQPKNSVYWTDIYDGPYNVVYGHNVHSLVDANVVTRQDGIKMVGIDTGCCFGGNMTAFILPEQRFVQVPAKETYKRRNLVG